MAAAPAPAQGAVALLGTCDPQQAAPASDLLFYVAEYEVLVCKEHGAAKAQTFFRTGGFQRYFAVLPSAAAEPIVLRAPAAVHNAEVATILTEYEEAKAKREEELKTADGSVAKTDRTGWFNRNGWPEHLARRNLGHLSRASRMPDHADETVNVSTRDEALAEESCRPSRRSGSPDSDADLSDEEQQNGESYQDPMRDARELFL
ncbi:recq family helicase [Stemphylium lycopersici]|nr:recq family helicase [Stemphylium lycopersici]RAQ93878.1 recq family helicase [Stemphylium lycopersici]